MSPCQVNWSLHVERGRIELNCLRKCPDLGRHLHDVLVTHLTCATAWVAAVKFTGRCSASDKGGMLGWRGWYDLDTKNRVSYPHPSNVLDTAPLEFISVWVWSEFIQCSRFKFKKWMSVLEALDDTMTDNPGKTDNVELICCPWLCWNVWWPLC